MGYYWENPGSTSAVIDRSAAARIVLAYKTSLIGFSAMGHSSPTPAHFPSDPKIPGILSAQVRLLYANSNLGVAVNVLAATILCYLQWGTVPNSAIVGWWLYMMAASLARFVLTQRYWHAPERKDTDRWRKAFAVGAALAGAGWGGAGILLYSEAHLLDPVFLVFIVGGMMLGAASVLAPRPEAFLAFLIPTGLAPTIRLLVQGNQGHLAMGLLAGVFTLATVVTTTRIYHTLDSSLRLRFQNQELIEELQTAKKETEAVNQALEIRVHERTAELRKSTEQLRAEISQREQIEEELFRARKLESLGVLAGGIAHDFNNFLTIIQGNIELAKANLEPAQSVRAVLDQAASACRRAAFLSSQLLTFAKGGAPIRQVVSIARLIVEAVQLARTGAPTSFSVHIADDTQRTRGSIRARSARCLHNFSSMPARLWRAADSSKSGRRMSFSKTAPMRSPWSGSRFGITAAVFQPTYCRKYSTPISLPRRAPTPRLATSYAIIAKHGGRISVESEAGQWTEFTIDLPASRELQAPQPPIAAPIEAGKERLLIMDDEHALRTLLRAVLSRLGYEVETARDGAEAIALYERAMSDGRGFDAVLLDLTVAGGMGGAATARRGSAPAV